jgi:HD-like signal output (HDOD) protein
MELSPLEQQQLDAISAAGLQIPPRPQVVAEVVSLLQQPEADNRQVARLITRDVKLTATVFKTVNSAAFGLSRRIDSVDQALAVMGQKRTSNIINAAGLRQQLGGDAKRYERFWERSTDLATLCTVVADKALGPKALNAEQAYMVGLFHDCGVPVLMQHMPGYCEIQPSIANPLSDVLNQDDAFQTSHCLVGYMVAEQWNLPEYLCQAIRGHHYVLEEGQAARVASAVLQMAMHIYNQNCACPDAEWEYHRGPVLAELKLDDENAAEFEQEVWSSFDILH